MKKPRLPLFVSSALLAIFACASSGGNGGLARRAAAEEGKAEDLVIKNAYFETLGDCTLAKIGDTDILIDCGGENQSCNDVITKLLEDVKDNVLEYVIITHQDEDHINGFATSESALPKWLLSGGTIDTLIDFDCTQDETVKDGSKFDKLFTAKTVQEYRLLRDVFASPLGGMKIRHYYTASQCTYQKRMKAGELEQEQAALIPAGATDTFELDTHGGPKATLKILYNCLNSTFKDGLSKSAIKNSMSVCSLLTYGEDKFLFTGDLEEYDSTGTEKTKYKRIGGETDLIKNNDELKGGVMFYRGGHHGSQTSSSEYFINVIRPQYVCWSGIAGKSPGVGEVLNYFPSQAAIDSVGRYTDRIYYSGCAPFYLNVEGDAPQKLYGQTVFTYSPKKKVGERMNVTYETKEPQSFFISSYMKKYIKDKAERSVPMYVYNLVPSDMISSCPVECSYVKIGHIDILLGAGALGNRSSVYRKSISKKIRHLCNDKILDYLIVPSDENVCRSFLFGEGGLLGGDDIHVKNIYVPAAFEEEFKELTFKPITTVEGGLDITVSLDEAFNDESVQIRFLSHDYTKRSSRSESSLMTHISAFDFHYLHMGTNDAYAPEIFSENADEKTGIGKKIDVVQLPKCGAIVGENADAFRQFIDNVSTKTSNHAYTGYGGNQKSESALDGTVVLVNTTFYVGGSGALTFPSSHLVSYDENIQNDSHGFFLPASGKKKLLFFPTMYTDKESKCKPFSDGLEGDLCLKVDATVDATNSIKKVRMRVAKNFVQDQNDSPLLFVDASTKRFYDEHNSMDSAIRIQ